MDNYRGIIGNRIKRELGYEILRDPGNKREILYNYIDSLLSDIKKKYNIDSDVLVLDNSVDIFITNHNGRFLYTIKDGDWIEDRPRYINIIAIKIYEFLTITEEELYNILTPRTMENIKFEIYGRDLKERLEIIDDEIIKRAAIIDPDFEYSGDSSGLTSVTLNKYGLKQNIAIGKINFSGQRVTPEYLKLKDEASEIIQLLDLREDPTMYDTEVRKIILENLTQNPSLVEDVSNIITSYLK